MNKLERKRAFTLVEIIVSIVIIFAAMLSSFQVLTYCFKYYATSRNKVEALKIGQAVAEEILKFPLRVFNTQSSPPYNLGNGTNGNSVVITDNNYFPNLIVPNVDMSKYRLIMPAAVTITTGTTGWPAGAITWDAATGSGNKNLKQVTIQITGPVDAAGNSIQYKTTTLEIKLVVSGNKY